MSSKEDLLDVLDEQKKTIEKYSNKLRGKIFTFRYNLYLFGYVCQVFK